MSDRKIDDFKAVSDAIMSSSKEFVGNLGLARAGIQILKYNKALQRGLIRVNHKHVDELKSSLTFIEKIDNKEVIVKSVGVSGMLNKAEERYLK